MEDNHYAPPRRTGPAPVGPSADARGPAALIWRVAFLCLFAGLNFYFSVPSHGNVSYLILGCICLGSAVLLARRSSWSVYPLYVATLIMGAGLVGGIYNYSQHPELLREPLPRQIISWAIPLVPMILLITCCTYARRFPRHV